MSISPVQAINPIPDLPSDGANARRARSSDLPQPPAPHQPNSGAEPKPVRHDPQRAPQSFELPQDEVQVQRDRETNNQIVIRYLDASGQLILQIPSSQVLGLARAIAQTFEEQASARETRATSQVELQGEESRAR